jgi:hypothetical protein
LAAIFVEAYRSAEERGHAASSNNKTDFQIAAWDANMQLVRVATV